MVQYCRCTAAMFECLELMVVIDLSSAIQNTEDRVSVRLELHACSAAKTSDHCPRSIGI
jgi:hypothetical protein